MYVTWATIKSPYVYQDVLTYTCNIGYGRTSGDETRTYDHNGEWTNTAPNCTSKHNSCTDPEGGKGSRPPWKTEPSSAHQLNAILIDVLLSGRWWPAQNLYTSPLPSL